MRGLTLRGALATASAQSDSSVRQVSVRSTLNAVNTSTIAIGNAGRAARNSRAKQGAQATKGKYMRRSTARSAAGNIEEVGSSKINPPTNQNAGFVLRKPKTAKAASAS